MNTAIKSASPNNHHAEVAASRWNWLYTLSGAAALAAGALFLATAVAWGVGRLVPGALASPAWPIQGNWLVVLFELHAGFDGVGAAQLRGLNLPDIASLALVAITHLGLYAALWKSSRGWSLVALAQALLAPVLFMATQALGRSGVMGAGLVISAVMLRGRVFGHAPAWVGIAASALLLLSDFSVGLTHSSLIAGLTGIGYALLIAWFCLMAHRLIQLGRGVSKPEGADR